MSLWMPWWNAIWRLRPAFSRLRSFLWFVTAVAGFTVRTELLGVTSLVRALKLEARFYNKLVDHFHSPAHQQRGPRKRGRPRVYGRKVKLSSLLQDPKGRQQAKSPVYGERQVVIQYNVRDLLWRPAGRLVRFVAVIHPTRGSCLLMCTDTSLAAIEIVRLYGLRFKIEHTFKQAVRLIGSFSYHFWMSDMKPLRRRSGNQHLHRASPEYRDAVRRKLHAYHVFIQAAVVCQGLLQ